jgi:hypothetical protein
MIVIDNVTDSDWIDVKIIINGEYVYGPAPNLFKAHKTLKLDQQFFIGSDGKPLGVPPIKTFPCEDIKSVDIQATVEGKIESLHVDRK